MIRTMMTCRWSRRHLSQFLDADPSIVLDERQAQRLEHHLATCARCARTRDELVQVSQALDRLGQRRQVDPAARARLDDVVHQLHSGDLR